MAQANPLCRVRGIVINSTTIDVPGKPAVAARPAGPDGPALPARPAEPAWSYLQLTVQTDAVIDGQVLPGLTGLLDVTFPEALGEPPAMATKVEIDCEAFPSARPNGRGGWRKVVTFRAAKVVSVDGANANGEIVDEAAAAVAVPAQAGRRR